VAVVVARSLTDALDALAGDPETQVLCGGTDVMVEVNHGQRRPTAVVCVSRIPELRGVALDGDGTLRIGAATTYADLLSPETMALAPALAAAARTVGSPQIRNAGTLGGNLGTGSPAGDTLPVLAALEATVVLVSARGERRLALSEFITGPKRTAIESDELISEVLIPAAEPGDAQDYLKVGTRNAMVIAVASCAVIARRADRTVRVGLGSVGPVPLRASEAEAWVAERIDWDRMVLLEPDATGHFGELVASAARPIDDHRSTAAYRRHAVGVLAARALRRNLSRSGAAA